MYRNYIQDVICEIHYLLEAYLTERFIPMKKRNFNLKISVYSN